MTQRSVRICDSIVGLRRERPAPRGCRENCAWSLATKVRARCRDDVPLDATLRALLYIPNQAHRSLLCAKPRGARIQDILSAGRPPLRINRQAMYGHKRKITEGRHYCHGQRKREEGKKNQAPDGPSLRQGPRASPRRELHTWFLPQGNTCILASLASRLWAPFPPKAQHASNQVRAAARPYRRSQSSPWLLTLPFPLLSSHPVHPSTPSVGSPT